VHVKRKEGMNVTIKKRRRTYMGWIGRVLRGLLFKQGLGWWGGGIGRKRCDKVREEKGGNKRETKSHPMMIKRCIRKKGGEKEYGGGGGHW